MNEEVAIVIQLLQDVWICHVRGVFIGRGHRNNTFYHRDTANCICRLVNGSCYADRGRRPATAVAMKESEVGRSHHRATHTLAEGGLVGCLA
jgi:hypothetical protein